MVVRSIDEQDESEEKRCDSSSGSGEIKETLKIDVPSTQESEWWFQECITPTSSTSGEFSSYYEALAWMWDTQDLTK